MWRMLQQDKPDDYVLATGRTVSVREFVDTAFRVAGIDIEWRGKGVDERGYVRGTDRCLIEVDPRYFRPTEVDLLLGDPSKAERELGWRATTTLEEMIVEMVNSDIKEHGTRNLLDLASRNKNLEGFLFFSSSEIYGDPDPRAVPIKEDYHGNVSTVGPRACYDESKRLGETLCTIYKEHHGVPAKIVRPFNVFGPGMGHNDRRVIPMFTYQALNGRTIPVHGTGLQTRTFCYITDAIYGFLMTLLEGKCGEAYNIGNPDNEISMIKLAEMYPKLLPGASFTRIDYPDTYPAGEPNRRCPDITKARETFGYTSEVDVEDGLARFIDWARNERNYIDFEPEAALKKAG